MKQTVSIFSEGESLTLSNKKCEIQSTLINLHSIEYSQEQEVQLQ